MKLSTPDRSRSSQAYSQAVVLVTAGAILLLLIFIGRVILIHYSPQRQLELKQESFERALEKHSGKKIRPYLAEDYEDQWGFDREDAALTVSDVGRHFMILVVKSHDTEYQIDGREAVVTTRLQLSGSGSPIANEVIRVVNRQQKAFVFTWKRQSFWPGSWRVTRIEHPGIPVHLNGYRPGDLKKMLGE